MIAKILLTAALTLSCGVGTPVHADPSVFGTLGCGCPDTPPGAAPAQQHDMQQHDIERGIADGLSGVPAEPPH
ncbi:hypothetical protein BRW65_19065 [Mycobacterium paraffinicum]|uniref:Secreted protein n=1 Tax=Mycobacterium paraffinicum TaxID=53378 RepID=A0A1Q4HRN7_9MYCO|nr:hypothetical protein [Mycobacterium paraffinicum]OJZ71366.1 hypothetical protein BRW65_19065 [Mycobacterium paraffinicum]